jgi:tRNA (guanine37-N1)-methyltransferase
MKISIITLFPDMFSGFLQYSIIGRAQAKGIVKVNLVNLREFAKDRYGTVDDRPYGGGPGMILRVDVLYACLESLIGNMGKEQRAKNHTRIILTSAKGATYSQAKAEKYARKYTHLIIICGHYEGVDERIMCFVDDELSIGQYVLTGGELPAAVIADSVVRLLPGVLKKDEASRNESFSLREKNGKTSRTREHPHYTRPREFMGMRVPEVLMSGDHRKINEWRNGQR